MPVLPGDKPFTFDPWDFDRWIVSGSNDEILDAPEWNEGYFGLKISPEQQLGARWHRHLLSHLFLSWKAHFVEVIRSGAAYIMARKNSILSPFEHVTWDQWQYFKLDEEPEGRLPSSPMWGDPRRFSSRYRVTATGPAGEKLYAIRVAPGSAKPLSSFEETNEKQVQTLLVKLPTDHPDRPPTSLPELANQICSEFHGLSERAFRRCLSLAQQQTGNRNWSEPGRRKSPQEYPHQTI
jgi:hypothetical protein